MKISFSLLLSFLLFGCGNSTSPQLIPETLKINYGKYKNRKLDLAFGDIVQVNNTQYKGIVCDISEDEGGLWYGIIFMKNDSLFGRKIPDGFGSECILLFDFTYLNYKGVSSVTKISKVNLDFDKIGCGAKSTAENENDLTRDYLNGIERRVFKETPCGEKLTMLDPVNEYYRSLGEIRIKQKSK